MPSPVPRTGPRRRPALPRRWRRRPGARPTGGPGRKGVPSSEGGRTPTRPTRECRSGPPPALPPRPTPGRRGGGCRATTGTRCSTGGGRPTRWPPRAPVRTARGGRPRGRSPGPDRRRPLPAPDPWTRPLLGPGRSRASPPSSRRRRKGVRRMGRSRRRRPRWELRGRQRSPPRASGAREARTPGRGCCWSSAA